MRPSESVPTKPEGGGGGTGGPQGRSRKDGAAGADASWDPGRTAREGGGGRGGGGRGGRRMAGIAGTKRSATDGSSAGAECGGQGLILHQCKPGLEMLDLKAGNAAAVRARSRADETLAWVNPLPAEMQRRADGFVHGRGDGRPATLN